MAPHQDPHPAASHPASACGVPREAISAARAAPHPDAAPRHARRMRVTVIALLAASVSAGGIGKFFRAHVDAVDKARPRSAVIEGIDVAVLKEARDAEAAVDAVSRSRGGEVAVEEMEPEVDGKAPLPDPLPSTISKGLRQQLIKELEQHGECVTIMVVGETGVGKTSLLSNLFHQQLEWPDSSTSGGRTLRVQEQVVTFDMGGVPFSARLVDSPGYGDSLDLARTFSTCVRYIDGCFRAALRSEQRIRRGDARAQKQDKKLVDVVLYFFSPHRAKEIDMDFLRAMRGKASIVPVLAKADTMTTAELQDFRATVTAALESAGIEIAHSPFAVVCAERPAKGGRRGRAYPWGMALSEEGAHSELPQLRAFLLTDGLLGLREAAAAHYEAYRARRLRAQRYGVGRVLRASVQLGLGALCVPKSRRWVRGKVASVRELAATKFNGIPFVPIPKLPPPPPKGLGRLRRK